MVDKTKRVLFASRPKFSRTEYKGTKFSKVINNVTEFLKIILSVSHLFSVN